METIKKNFVDREAKQLYEIKNKRTDILTLDRLLKKYRLSKNFRQCKKCKMEGIVKKNLIKLEIQEHIITLMKS